MAEMDCNEAAVLITALVDGELPVEDVDRIQAHLGRCSDCASRKALEERLKAFLHDRLARVSTPPDLKDRIRDALAGMEGGGAAPGGGGGGPTPKVTVRRARPPRSALPRWVPVSALIALLVAMVGGMIFMEGGGRQVARDDLLEPITALHWAATQAGVFQVRTSSAQELTDWLVPRTGPFASVPELTSLGMNAAGGRVVHLNKHTMAMALYRDYDGKKPDITLLEAGPDFTWPEATGEVVEMEGTPVHRTRFRRMEVAAFAHYGVTCVLVSLDDAKAMDAVVHTFIRAMEGPTPLEPAGPMG
jgi:anti-sigma factor (TIGR02949 family)